MVGCLAQSRCRGEGLGTALTSGNGWRIGRGGDERGVGGREGGATVVGV